MSTQPQKKEESPPKQDQPLVTESQPEIVTEEQELPPVTQVGKTYTEADMQAIHNLYGTALQEKQREIDAKAQAREQIQQHNPEQDSQQLMTDPRALIRSEIDAAIAPLAQGLQQFQAMSVYDNYKNQFKNHPQYARHFKVPGFEGNLDQVMQGVQQVTIPIMQEAIRRVLGYMVENNLYQVQTQQIPTREPNNPQPNPQPNPQNNNNPNMNLPAHLRPSGPPAPNRGDGNLTPKGNVRRQLTENEKRVARERKMSEDTYIDWLSESSTNVVKSDIGRPAK